MKKILPKLALSKKRDSWEGVAGVVAFLAGVVISIATGTVLPYDSNIGLLLVVLGLLVGLLNITLAETMTFLVATTAFIVAAYTHQRVLTVLPVVGPILPPIFDAFIVFLAPALLIVAFKAIYQVAKDR